MASPPLVASILLVVPAMGVLGYLLKRYEGHFEQGRLFFALAAGLFLGTGVKYLEVGLFPFDTPGMVALIGPFASFAYSAVGFAMLAAAAMAVVLGLRRFRGRKDTPYYGPAMGFPFGAMYVMPVTAISITEFVSPNLRLDGPAVATLLTTLAYALGLLLSHGAAGAWVGRGSAGGRLWQGLMHGTLWLIPAYALSWVWTTRVESVLLQGGDNAYLAGIIPALAALAYGAFALSLAQAKVMDPIVPPEIRDQIRKERRRAQRRA